MDADPCTCGAGIEEELGLSDLLEFPTLGEFTAHLESLMAPSEESGTL